MADSDSSESESEPKRRRLDVPTALSGLFARDDAADVAKHGGRQRRVAHVEGNYPTLVFLPVSVSPAWRAAGGSAQALLRRLGAAEVAQAAEAQRWHISLSPLLMLRRQFIKPFEDRLRQVLKGLSIPESLQEHVWFNESLQVFSSLEADRYFAGVSVADSSQRWLRPLAGALRRAAQELGLEVPQQELEEMQLHCSLAWTVSNLRPALEANKAQLQESPYGRVWSLEAPLSKALRLRARCLHARIGDRTSELSFPGSEAAEPADADGSVPGMVQPPVEAKKSESEERSKSSSRRSSEPSSSSSDKKKKKKKKDKKKKKKKKKKSKKSDRCGRLRRASSPLAMVQVAGPSTAFLELEKQPELLEQPCFILENQQTLEIGWSGAWEPTPTEQFKSWADRLVQERPPPFQALNADGVLMRECTPEELRDLVYETGELQHLYGPQVDATTDCEGWIYATAPARLDVQRLGGRATPRFGDRVRRRRWRRGEARRAEGAEPPRWCENSESAVQSLWKALEEVLGRRSISQIPLDPTAMIRRSHFDVERYQQLCKRLCPWDDLPTLMELVLAAVYSRAAYGHTGRRGFFDTVTQGAMVFSVHRGVFDFAEHVDDASNELAFLDMLGLRPEDLVCAQWRSPGPLQPAFAVCRDHSLRWIVVAVRGTLSSKDILTDCAVTCVPFLEGGNLWHGWRA
ncbi:unnamed protein product [Effrenium voratum]|nr:unnamed protein product [Effrenium voratum]